MANKWLISTALGLEAASWGAAFSPLPSILQVPAFAVPHAGASALLALVLQRLLPAHYRQPRLAGWFCLFSVGFFIPFLGALGLFTTTLLALYLPRRCRTVPWQTIQPKNGRWNRSEDD